MFSLSFTFSADYWFLLLTVDILFPSYLEKKQKKINKYKKDEIFWKKWIS